MAFHFLMIFPEFPMITKKEIDKGVIPETWREICSVLRNVFFLSNKMRKERSSWIYFARAQTLFAFKGAELRYLGPDERSTLMLFLKGFKALEGRAGTIDVFPLSRSTPGVYPGYISVERLLETFVTSNKLDEIRYPRFGTPDAVANEPGNEHELAVHDHVPGNMSGENQAVFRKFCIKMDEKDLHLLSRNVKVGIVMEATPGIMTMGTTSQGCPGPWNITCTSVPASISGAINFLNLLEDFMGFPGNGVREEGSLNEKL